jgi:hypothetical protein
MRKYNNKVQFFTWTKKKIMNIFMNILHQPQQLAAGEHAISDWACAAFQLGELNGSIAVHDVQ